MPKSAAERVKAYLVRKREYAREAGFCYTCRKERPDPRRVICRSCNAANVQRKRRKREQNRNPSGIPYATKLLEAHEHAGDVAHERFFYDGAAQHYRDALEYVRVPTEWVRISEKLIRTLYAGNNPMEASRWLEETLSVYDGDTEHGSKLAELLLMRAAQYGAKGSGEGDVRDIARAIEIAKNAGNLALYKFANYRMIELLRNLGRIREAESYFDAIGNVDDNDDASLRQGFFCQRGRMEAQRGMTKDAYAYFERALLAAQEKNQEQDISVVLVEYGRWALALGDTLLAKANLEKALLQARHAQYLWYIPYVCLEYVDVLARMGSYSVGHHYLREALSEEAPAPAVQMLYPEAGIRLALEVKDNEALERCSQIKLLEAAFKSEAPAVYGPVAAGFARLFSSRSQTEQAQNVLHRALHLLKNIGRSWDLCLEVAREGRLRDIPHARRLLESRVALPHSKVAQAYLDLFEAFVASRSQQREKADQHAERAAERFESLQWNAYADLAYTLLPVQRGRRRALEIHESLTGIRSLLTTRQQQIAELVLQGLSNREISRRLSISKYTVGSHVAAILNRIGIRSRHQLVEASPENVSLNE